jgi:urea transport system substrate-binding protein
VIEAAYGQKFNAPCGFELELDANHHLHKPVFIGEIRPDGQFSVVWKTKGPVRAQPWSPFIPGNESKPDHLAAIPLLPVDHGIDTATAADLSR